MGSFTVTKQIPLSGLNMRVTGSTIDVFVYDRKNVSPNASVTEKFGGFEIWMIEELSKIHGFNLKVLAEKQGLKNSNWKC